LSKHGTCFLGYHSYFMFEFIDGCLEVGLWGEMAGGLVGMSVSLIGASSVSMAVDIRVLGALMDAIACIICSTACAMICLRWLISVLMDMMSVA